ncbi:MAG: hydroxyacylglutathione hydrolase [Myxococcota bacterium]
MSEPKVTPIPCLSDNYAYLAICPETREAAVVDPSEAAPVERAVRDAGVTLKAILNTHHHWDHVGGNEELLAARPDLAVYGHTSDEGRIPGQTVLLEDGDTVRIGLAEAGIRHVPGHTLGAVAYCFDGHVFTGDTLFQGGCGKLFEGTPEMMYRSLVEVLAGGLPGDIRVWCGHEYTVKNLEFACSVEPDNVAARDRLEWARARRAEGLPTIPSTLDDEKAFNPFVRTRSPEALADLRRRKDVF